MNWIAASIINHKLASNSSLGMPLDSRMRHEGHGQLSMPGKHGAKVFTVQLLGV